MMVQASIFSFGKKLLFTALAILLLSPSAFAQFRAGAAAIDITPPPGIPLGGYSDRKGRPLKGVHDRIFAKALVLDDGKIRLALVTADLIGADIKFQRAIARANQLKLEAVMVCASHTHSGPGALSNSIVGVISLGSFNPRYYRWLRARLIQVVKTAISRLTPARLAIGIDSLPGRNRNRRKGEKIVDPQLVVIRVDSSKGKPLAILVNYSAHGTILGSRNMLVSADWMGYTQRYLEKAIGGKAVALYANGAEGDLSPIARKGKTRFERCRDMGEAVGYAAKKLYDRLKTSSKVVLHAAGEEFNLPRTLRAVLLAKEMSFIQIMVIDGIAFAALPGEFTAPVGLDIKNRLRRLGYKDAVVMGLANDHLGYVLTEKQFARGGYEVGVSFYGKKFGPQMVRAISALASRLKEAMGR